jgi:glycosyltransferase involved in cell wall biosynthesis
VTTHGGRTLAIIPAYNEEDALGGTITELRSKRPGVDILVVDDGSTDLTSSVARHHRVAVVRLPYNVGIGGALRVGFRYAIAKDYWRAFQFDADGQHDPAEVAALLDALDQGADLVVGSRFIDGRSDYDVGRFRRSAMHTLRLSLRILLGRRFSDTSSGFRAFSRPMLEYFADNYPAEYMESVEALMLACFAGFRVTEVPARMRARLLGTPSNRSLRLVYHFARLYVVMWTTAGSPAVLRCAPRLEVVPA